MALAVPEVLLLASTVPVENSRPANTSTTGTFFSFLFRQVIDPDDLPQRARWTIIATACLLLIMCLLLVGITLRMAPIIDDMGKYGRGSANLH
uniref:Uncharacterized protein n=1 Tax=Anopheles stephensi TaxID=30069 RepID=A0A182YFQ4_ANOST